MVEVSFDLDEKIVKILDELVANSGGKTESEVLEEIIKRDMQVKVKKILLPIKELN